MHTFNETGAGVPAFLAKLWRLVEDPETNDLICWSMDGRSFIIQNQAQFAKELLPLNYKHNNMASFIRQLNMYGFHKITSIDNGGLRFDKDEMEFTHPCFQKDHPYLLEHIKRKIATSKQQDDKNGLKVEAMNRVLSEMKNMRGKQDSLDSRFASMKQENEALWREIAILRQKHLKQQQIVNKLIQFLVTIVQPSRSGLGSMGNGNNKRRFQLMINDAPQSKTKKTDSNEGATIQELGEALEEVAYENEQEMLSSDIPEVTSPISIPQRSPYHSGSVNEMIEEVAGAQAASFNVQLGNARVKQEQPDRIAGVSEFTAQNLDEGAVGGQITDDYDNEGYLVDHVDEIDPNNMQLYDDTDMLNTPLVLKEMEKQEQLKQQQQQLQQKIIQQPRNVNKGESLLKAKKNGIAGKAQKSLLTSSKPMGSNVSDNNNAPKTGKQIQASGKELNIKPTVNLNAEPSGLNSFISSAAGPSLSSVGYDVGDFIINEVPTDIFEDDSQLEKQSPMLGAFNFEGGFYNPNININEMKGRQQITQQQQQQQDVQPSTSDAQLCDPNRNAESTKNAGAMAKFISNNSDVSKFSTVNEYGQHFDTVQNDLDTLKDLLKGDGYQLDANTLLGVAGGNDPQYGRVFFSQFDGDAISKLFNNNEDIIGYDFPMNLPDLAEAQKKSGKDNTLTFAADSGEASSSAENVSQNPAGSSNQLMAYKTVPGNNVTGDYIDLNELLYQEGSNEDENSAFI